MFTFLSRFRRQTAVLTALALVASVLVAVPVSAADDPPKSSYGATFTACLDIPEAEFGDVLDTQTDADNINCIAYYNITMGKSATTYDPLASVTREEMALFLTRLADVVGIPMVADPADPGFTDIGDLNEEAQTAIAQLKELGITKGNNASGTTYGPGHQVTRGDMALFIARLMRKMTPISDGDDSGTDWGYTPADVEKNEAVVEDGSAAHIGTPFGDLDRVTKETYDAITNLYELKVASGISATAYGPSQSIRRDHMARFMAGVLHHSNARPAGLTIQAAPVSGFAITPTVVVSVRSDSLVPMVDQAVDTFSSGNRRTMGLNDDGTCNFTDGHVDRGDCEWSDSDEVTNSQGNLQVDDSAVDPGATRLFYAWIGDDNGDGFDADEVEEQTVSVTSSNAEASLKIKALLPDNVGTTEVDHDGLTTSDPEDAFNVHLGRTNKVTITVQLVDDAAGAGDPVAREGVAVSVTERQQQPTGLLIQRTVDRKTDEHGQIAFEVTGPKDDKTVADQSRVDTITFTHKVGTETKSTSTHINWIEAASQPAKLVGSGPDYVILTKGEVSVPVSAVLYDQYGKALNPTRLDDESTSDVDKGKVTFAFTPEATVDSDDDANTVIEDDLNRNGKASVRVKSDTTSTTTAPSAEGDPIVATMTAFWGDGTTRIQDGTADVDPDTVTVQVVVEAGSSTDFGDAVYVTAVLAKENKFLASTEDGNNNAELLVSYHKDDTFIFDGTANGFNNGDDLTIDQFEKQIAPTKDANGAITAKASVDVVVYRPNGLSIFKVIPATPPS